MHLLFQLILSGFLIVAIYSLGQFSTSALGLKGKLNFLTISIGLIILILILSVSRYLKFSNVYAGIILLAAFLKQQKHLKLKLSWGVVVGFSGFVFVSMCLLLQSFYMSFNSGYPLFFFNVDTPFSIMVSESLTMSLEYPPLLLDNVADGVKYHFGYYQLVAFWCKSTSMPVYRVHSLIMAPGLVAIIFGLLVQFFEMHIGKKSIKATLLAIIVYFGYQQYLYNYLKPSTVVSLITFPERYKALFPLVPNLFEAIYFLVTIWLLRANTNKTYLMAAMLIASIPLIKIPLAPAMGIGFALYCLSLAMREKRIILLLYPILTALLMLTIYSVFGSNGQAIKVEWFKPTHILKDQWFAIVMPIMVLVLVFIFTSKLKLLLTDKWLQMFLFVLPMPILLLLVNFRDHNAWQLISVSAFASWVISVIVLVKYWPSFKRIWQYALVVLTGFAILIPVLNTFYTSFMLVKSPLNGGEVVSNAMLATALKDIPVKGTLLATNDLRYPANEYHRPEAQMQFSALFGHQMFVSNLHYLVPPGFGIHAEDFLSKIPRGQLTLTDVEFFQKHGVTHYVQAVCDSSRIEIPVIRYEVFNINEVYQNLKTK